MRELIQALAINELSLPRHFKTTNRGYIRNVIHVHFAEPVSLSPMDDLSSLLPSPSHCVRVTRAHSNQADEVSLSPLPRKLLSLSFDECSPEELLFVRASDVTTPNTVGGEREGEIVEANGGTGSAMWRSLSPYVMNVSLRKMWNYPLPCSVYEDERRERDLLSEGETEPSAKRRKTESESENVVEYTGVPDIQGESERETVGVKVGSVPSLSTCLSLLSSSTLSPCEVSLYSDFPRNTQLQTNRAEYFQTMSVRSESYKRVRESLRRERVSAREGERVFAIDCEMVQTNRGSELARVTVLADREGWYTGVSSTENVFDDGDDDSVVVLDTFVRPSLPVTDYKTQWSGITAESLAGVTVSLLQVQVALLGLISAEAIVVGHSLDSDLQALRLVHGRTVDTACLYPHPRGFPLRHKLKLLAKEILGLDIQTQHNRNKRGANSKNTPIGHDSVEDARTALKLVIRKLEGGPSFGLNTGTAEARVALANRLALRDIQCLLAWETAASNVNGNNSEEGHASSDVSASTTGRPLRDVHNEAMESCIGGDTKVVRHSNLDQLVQRVCAFVRHGREGEREWKSLACTTAEELVQKAITTVKVCSLNVCKTRADRETVERVVTSIRTSLSSLEVSRGHTALIVTCQPSLERVQRLQEKKRLCMSQSASLSTLIWSSENEMELKGELKKIQLGRVSFGVL